MTFYHIFDFYFSFILIFCYKIYDIARQKHLSNFKESYILIFRYYDFQIKFDIKLGKENEKSFIISENNFLFLGVFGRYINYVIYALIQKRQ